MTAPQLNPSMNWSATNLAAEWIKFEEHAKLMFLGPLKRATAEEQAAYLRIWVGEKGREIFRSWNLSEADGKKIDDLFTKFNQHCAPKKNTVFSRYLFQERKQKEDEPFETFVTDLRNLVKACEYTNSDEMVRDRIVAGVQSREIREKLLTEGDTLTMEKAIEIATHFEATQQCLASMASKPPAAEVASLHRKKPVSKFKPEQSTPRYTSISNCKNCSGTHAKRSCPAYGQTCHFCKKKNHYEKCCLKKKKNKHNVHSLEEEDDHSSDHEFYVYGIHSRNSQPDTVCVDLQLNTGDSINVKVDTGAQVNVLPMHSYQKLTKPPPLGQTKQKLYAYSGQALSIKGQITMECKYKDKTLPLQFIVADKCHTQPILGLKSSLDLDLIKLVLSVSEPFLTKESVLSEYKTAFNGLGALDGDITVHLKPNSTPKVHPPRRVPHALNDRVQEELKRMEKLDVIERVTDPTDWVNSMVVVEKPNGKLRICLDPKDLNEAIRRPHYSVPTLEHALAKMSNAKFFSKLDAQSGYWQLRLSEESSFLTTFNTPFGRYRFKRLPFGLVCAQDVFQQKMDEIFEGIPGVTPLVDDIIISGATQEEHDKNLRAALDRAIKKNLKLNSEKLEVGVQQIEYFGHLITSEGLKPDPAKVQAITDMPPPSDRKELQTVLGMITYLSKFMPKLSEVTKPMRDLLKAENEFIWDAAQQDAFNKTKTMIASQPVLAFYDPEKEITLEVDASQHGLGATILQDGKPVAFASKALTTTEQNYAQIEKELYAILFGCSRFHQYVYGRKTIVHSDHKPLETVMKKPMSTAPPRLQRMMLQLQKYDINVKHVPGKSIPVADTLSRKHLPTEDDMMSKELDAQIHTIMKNLPISDTKLKEVRKATENDPELRHLKTYIQQGWPETRKQCHSSAADFWNFRDEISMIDGIIMKGDRIYIPVSVRPVMLKRLHEGHLGIEKTTQRARQVMFWPRITQDIKTLISSCPICIPHLPSNAKEPLISHEVPTRPWQKVGTDLFTCNNKNYIITVDYYSRYFELDELNSTTSIAIIKKLSAQFARHGVPEIVMSDNGPQFSSMEFAQFASTWDFRHVTSSPGYPQSNGLAEKSVQTAKKIIVKAQEEGTNYLRALLEYRSTPVDNLASPAQLLMGRQLRSILPVTSQQLTPKTIHPDIVIQRRQELQRIQAKQYNRTAHPLPELKVGHKAQIQLSPGEQWQPVNIASKTETPRSFIAKTPDGNLYRRNRRFFRHNAEESPQLQPNRDEKQPEADQVSKPPPAMCTKSGRQIHPPKKLNL